MPLDFSKQLSSMGSLGHHIYSGGHAVGKITSSGHIYDHLGHRMGTIEKNGTVRDRAWHKMGRVDGHGGVYNQYSGHAQLHTFGSSIRDAHGKEVGRTSGGALGGAAMLLMLNKDQ